MGRSKGNRNRGGGAIAKNASSPKRMSVTPVEKAAGEILHGMATEGIIEQEDIEKAAPKVAEIILRIQHNAAIVRGYFVSPFAPYEQQAKVEELCPGVTDRQMAVFENRMATRNKCDVVHAYCMPVGMILGFALVSYTIYSGVQLIRVGRPIDGLISMFVPLSILAGIFLINKKKKKEESESDEWT